MTHVLNVNTDYGGWYQGIFDNPHQIYNWREGRVDTYADVSAFAQSGIQIDYTLTYVYWPEGVYRMTVIVLG